MSPSDVLNFILWWIFLLYIDVGEFKIPPSKNLPILVTWASIGAPFCTRFQQISLSQSSSTISPEMAQEQPNYPAQDSSKYLYQISLPSDQSSLIKYYPSKYPQYSSRYLDPSRQVDLKGSEGGIFCNNGSENLIKYTNYVSWLLLLMSLLLLLLLSFLLLLLLLCCLSVYFPHCLFHSLSESI